MTCREKLKLEHPERIDPDLFGGCDGCPDDYGYLPVPKLCDPDSKYCTICWDREIPTELEVGKGSLTINGYQQAALRTESGSPKGYPRLLNGLMGLNGEAGECIDILKKHLFQGHELDREHMAKELGDVAWYLAVSADALGYDLETILQMNIDKLKARYPEGFNSEFSQNRKEGDV